MTMTTNAEWMLKQGMKFSDLTWGYIKGKCIVYYKAGERFDELYSEKSVKPKDIILKWLDMEHVEPILDEAEKRYLKGVIRPFIERIKCIRKYESDESGKDFISITFTNNKYMDFPNFTRGTMYTGMSVERAYTLKELGL